MQVWDPQLTFQAFAILDVLDLGDLAYATLEPLLAAGNTAAPAPPAGDAAGAHGDASVLERPLDLPVLIRADIIGGCIVLPHASESRRAVVGTARRLTIGIPGRAIEGADTGVTASAGLPATHRASCLPHVTDMLPTSAAILERHHAASQVRTPGRPALFGSGHCILVCASSDALTHCGLMYLLMAAA